VIVPDGCLFRRTRLWTVIGGLGAGVAAALIFSIDMGLGVLAGAVWSTLNLRAMEGLLSAAVLPQDSRRDIRAIIFWSIIKLAVYVTGIWLLVAELFPAVALALGLAIMLAALMVTNLTTRSRPGREGPGRDDGD
jgi:hypothetical protein